MTLRLPLSLFLAVSFLANWRVSATLKRPCTPLITEDCQPRFVKCNTTHGAAPVLDPSTDYNCKFPGAKAKIGAEVVVQVFPPNLVHGTYECLEVLMGVGENWGEDSDGDNYDCMGACGPGCSSGTPGTCVNWSLNCLRHDVCSYYYNAAGGLFDPNCGVAFGVATPNYLIPCLLDSSCEAESINFI